MKNTIHLKSAMALLVMLLAGNCNYDGELPPLPPLPPPSGGRTIAVVRKLAGVKKEYYENEIELNENNILGDNNKEGIDCIICWDGEIGHKVGTLNCCHSYFHLDCILDWFRKEVNKLCPGCHTLKDPL